MADYLYSVAIEVNSFQNNMADKTVRQINWERINEYSLYIHVDKLYIYPWRHVAHVDITSPLGRMYSLCYLPS